MERTNVAATVTQRGLGRLTAVEAVLQGQPQEGRRVTKGGMLENDEVARLLVSRTTITLGAETNIRVRTTMVRTIEVDANALVLGVEENSEPVTLLPSPR